MSPDLSSDQRTRKTALAAAGLSRRGVLAGLLYEGAVVAAAVGGAVTHESRYWIALLAMTLICGIVAFIGLYACYGLLATLGTALGAHMSASGYGPLWFVIPDGIIDVALFAAAGAANVLLVSKLSGCLARRRHTRANAV